MKNLFKKIKEKIRPFMPQWVINFKRLLVKQIQLYKRNKLQSRYQKILNKYPKILNKLRNKERIKVAFFFLHVAVWKCDNLFKLMLEDKKFDPIIVICPHLIYGDEFMIRNMKQAEEFIRSKNYPYVVTMNYETGEWLDVRNIIKPDIIFFLNPYEGITKDEYYILNFPNSLTCYIPYSSMICSTPIQYNKPMQLYTWKFFIENNLIYNINCKFSPNKGRNTIITGSPFLDVFFNDDYEPKNVWKHSQPRKIIWAPHHTIEDNPIIQFSSFLFFADFMIDIANKYNKEIQIAFKPHPLLYLKLLSIWGKEKTDEYYKRWDSMINTQIAQDEYIDLFYTSDAMIFDSVSFINEYLYTKKPSIFIYKEEINKQLNEFGLKALSCHQKANNKNDIVKFIENIIREEEDTNKDKKNKFINDFLVPPNSQSASEKILNYIKSSLV